MKNFEETITFDLKYKINKKNRLWFLNYCLISEQEKQAEWETRGIRKSHSKNVKFLSTLITRVSYGYDLFSKV